MADTNTHEDTEASTSNGTTATSDSKFSDFGLSALTLRGLQDQKFAAPTAIQLRAIPTALEGRDILGAARTGSGKTLAFLIPLLEQLYAANWSPGFGLGALVISPTRELAYQTYEVLRKIGKHHNFSAALVIGGSLAAREQEKKCLYKINIVVGTPGRLLDHLSANSQFDAANLKLVVLDEADRILDLGFQETVDAILEYLPKRKGACQKMLFSATQGRRIDHLARRLNLNDPVFVSADEESPYATPERLKQTYCIIQPEHKLDFIFSFVSYHRHAKILVFMQACKEVRFFYQALCHLRPGVSVLALYGHMGQMKRVDMYEQFHRKKHACLIATDVAARGLDFPAVDWVVQLDAPENENEYIHRVGRTARLNSSGQSLLVLTNREEQQEKLVERLQNRRIPIEKMDISPRFLRQTRIKLESYCAARPEIKLSAQACLRAYLRSLWLLKKRDEVLDLDLEALAQSYGLLLAPKLRFIERARQKRADAGENEDGGENGGDAGNDEATDTEAALPVDNDESTVTKITKKAKNEHSLSKPTSFDAVTPEDRNMFERKKRQPFPFPEFSSSVVPITDDNNQTDPNASFVPAANVSRSRNKIPVSKAMLARKLLKKNIQVNNRVVFDDHGDVARVVGFAQRDIEDAHAAVRNNEKQHHFNSGAPLPKHKPLDVAEARERLQQADRTDKKQFRERIKRQHDDIRHSMKASRKQEMEDRS